MALKQESKLITSHVKEVLAGKSSSYQQLYTMHGGRIYIFGLKFFDHNKQAAEELTKRVFIRGYEEISTYPENITFILWLKQLAVQEITKVEIEKSSVMHQSSDVDRALFELPEEERIIFILHDIDKHSIEEVLAITKDSDDDINMRLENARKLMMEKLEMKDLDDLDYKINFLQTKAELPNELWENIYSKIHSIATKDLKEETKGEVLNVGDAKESLGEKFQKLKDEKKKKEVYFKPVGTTVSKRTIYTALLFILIAASVWYLFFLKSPQWEAENLSGAPTIKNNLKNITIKKNSIFEKNDLLDTHGDSKAVIKIPGVGEIYINSGSSVKRDGNSAELTLINGDIDVVKKDGSKSFPIEINSAIVEDYKPGSYSLKLKNDKAAVYSASAGLLISSGGREVYVIPNYMCEINSIGQVGIPYSLSATKEYIDAVNDFSNGNNERLNIILLQSGKKDALTVFNILPIVDKGSRDIVINKLHSLVRIPKDVNPHQVANLDKEDLEKWLKAIEEQQ